MNNDLREQIRNTLNLKDTNELLDIWQINNRAEWSDDAFDVIKDILMERGEEIFEQDDPIYEVEESDEETLEEKMESWELKVLDAEEQPELYSVVDVISLSRNITRISKAAAVVYALFGILSIRALFVTGFPGSIALSNVSQYGFEIFAILFNVGLKVALIYYPLKALTYILRILMQMEFNSRKAE